ncbi:DUF2235 domain-containing protein [Phaeovulum sp.]|uniref:DUF2235 domain-containing protein n=1 Tax=Phaeovulum sp. TaxID=2934796 RepID=UPI00356A7C5E
MPGRFIRRIVALLGGRKPTPPTGDLHLPHRAPVDHVVLLDGTQGKLRGVDQTSIGRIYELLREASPRGSIRYGQGLQWNEWGQFSHSILGWGIEQQIHRTYGWLATRYRPGDRIFLLGYSRGAFAVRSLAGIIDRVGLLRADAATERNVHLAWRYYEANEVRPGTEAFRRRFCHPTVEIEMVGVFDTVMALGFRFPLAWVFSEPRTRFHNASLGRIVRHGYQALALNETRSVFEPQVWDTQDTGALGVEQVWFRGCHGDIGGQLGHDEAARPLANIPLVWMLERMEHLGLALPEGWRDRFPCDPQAPSVGSWRGWSKLFWLRAPRVVGRDPSESIHESAVGARMGWRALIRPDIWRRRPASVGGAAHDKTGGGTGRV